METAIAMDECNPAMIRDDAVGVRMTICFTVLARSWTIRRTGETWRDVE